MRTFQDQWTEESKESQTIWISNPRTSLQIKDIVEVAKTKTISTPSQIKTGIETMIDQEKEGKEEKEKERAEKEMPETKMLWERSMTTAMKSTRSPKPSNPTEFSTRTISKWSKYLPNPVKLLSSLES